MNSSRSRFMPSSNGRSTAASTARIAAFQASKPRNLRALALRNLSKISGWPRAASTLSLRSRTLRSGIRVSMTLRAKASAPSRSLPSSTSSSTRPHSSACLALNGRAGHDHLERLLDADDARQALGAAGAGQEAELDLRQAELRGRHGDAVVAGQRHFEAAAERRAVDRGDDRLGAALDRGLNVEQRWRPCGGLPNSEMSAPAMKVRPSQISTMALTAGSAAACAMPSLRPSRTLADSALTGGELSVSTAMSPSRVRSVTALMAAILRAPFAFLWSYAEISWRAKYDKRRWGGAFVSLFDLDGKVALVTGSSRGHRPRDRRADGRARSQGRRLLAQGRALPGGRRRDQRQIRRGARRRHPGEHLLEGAARASGRRDDARLRPDRRAGLQRRIESALRADATPSPTNSSRKMLDNNIVSNHWLINLVAPQMIARKDGSIIIVSSIGGLRGSPVIGAYCVSKAADLQLARNLAIEFGPHNVRINCIAPGLIRTYFAQARSGKIRRTSNGRPRERRSAASASPTKSPAPRSCWPRRPAPS